MNLFHAESDCQVVWEKKPTPEEEQKAKSLQLPPTFFCGLSTTDSDTDADKAEDFETEVRKAQQELVRDKEAHLGRKDRARLPNIQRSERVSAVSRFVTFIQSHTRLQ